MRYAIISDVHSNIEALKAVLMDIKKTGIREIFFLGDAVGYGPDPEECLRILGAECKVLIAGNHDMAALGLTDIRLFNHAARTAIEWTSKRISHDNIQFLRSFKMFEDIPEKNIFLVHSTPKNPEEWFYLETNLDAEVNFHYFSSKVCFLGHTHKPFIVERKPSGKMLFYRDEIKISAKARYIINAGSVGQPRDGDPRACYCIFDGGVIHFRRIEYDVKTTQDKMTQYGLPDYLIERLSYGV